MKTFTYENQGAETLLVYHLDQEEHLDDFAKGMLQSNEMTGILRPSFVQRDMDQYLKFPVTSKIPLKDYLNGEMEKDTVLKLCISVTEAVQEVEEYMLTREKLILNPDYIFVDISKKEADFLYLPVDEYMTDIPVKEFFLYLLSHMRFQMSEDISYVAKLIHFLNDPKTWEFQDFQRYIKVLMEESAEPKLPPETSPQSNRPVEGLGVPLFEQQDVPLPVQLVPETQETGAAPEETGKKKKGLFGKREKKEKPNKAVKGLAPGMEVPGMEIPGMPVPDRPAPGPEVVLDVDENGKILMEQGQAEEKKKSGLFRFGKKKQNGKTGNEIPEPVMEAPLQAFQQAVQQPLQVSMGRGTSDDDNRTVIMGGGNDYGHTVVLGGGENTCAQMRQVVKLTRRRNGQSMMINKEVFHIGREGSFADFFIGDNPAIGAAHADIFLDAGQYFVSDRNSLNHTYVNGSMVAAGQPRPLRSGDVITLADEDFDFIIS